MDARRVLSGLYVGRVLLAGALFLAVSLPGSPDTPGARMVGIAALVSALTVTAGSFYWTGLRRREPGDGFRYLQVAFDMLLVTAAVHVTWGEGRSEVAPLYILVIAVSALLIPPSGIPLIASLGITLYVADAILAQPGHADLGLFIQLVVFAIVALTCAFIAARLGEEGRERELLVAELARFRLQEPEMRRLVLRAERLEGVAEMSASLAHEIRNPLASIRSAVEQLARMPRASEDEKVLSGLVQRESDRLSRLLTDFLDFGRTGVNRLEQVDLSSIAANAARLAAARPGMAEGVRVVENIPDRPMPLEADEDLLHQGIFNLLLNALQASPPGGEVRIEAGELQRHQLPAGRAEFAEGAWAIRVTDTGAGIQEDVRDRMFDPFVTTKPGGSGLGLSIVQRAVRAHGGIVTVSPPGEETHFTIVLPKSRQP